MGLTKYFDHLLQKVEASDIDNGGKDDNGFYRPTRSILIQKLNMLKDLHASPGAKPMLKDAWKVVTETLPPEWLVLSDEDKAEMKRILS
ncbi:MAG: hypothetical protein V4692_12290 [Bdellovibrionota bacterium]